LSPVRADSNGRRKHLDQEVLEWDVRQAGSRRRREDRRCGCPAEWYNNRRLFEAVGNIPPAQTGSAYYATMTPSESLEWQNKPSTELGAVQLGA
jgi:hypothetical protein